MVTITSAQNPEIKHVVKLHARKYRYVYNHCIIEGIRAIETALSGGMQLITLFTTKEYLTQALSLVPEQSIVLVSEPLMQKISTASTASGLLGVFAIPQPKQPLTAGLVLAQISDPGNMGTLIRTAAACSVKSVVVVEGVDPWSPKVLQASVGTIALVSLFQLDWQTLLENKHNLKLYALVVKDGVSINTISATNSLLVVGNEAHGIPVAWQETCDQLVSLPMPGGTESLNAAVAGSLALYITHVLNKY